MRLPLPFVQLPFKFDAEVLAAEVRALPDSVWMAHPSGLTGNSAAALISHVGGDNDDFAGQMVVTPHLIASPYIRQVMASFDEVLGRSRLMKLAVGSEVSRHIDFNYHWYSRLRIHIPVITNPGVIFTCGDAQVHMQAGESWIFDSWRWHRVVNEGAEDRVHLVIDLSGSSRFWQTVAESVAAGGSPETCRRIEPDQEDAATLRTERYNTAPVMAPGEVEAIARELISDFERCDENSAELVTQYRVLLENFGRDWRELWYQYGPHAAGWPHYRQLINMTQGQLHPERRALVTYSNGVGVNPVIVQRLLRAALVIEVNDEFQAKPGES